MYEHVFRFSAKCLAEADYNAIYHKLPEISHCHSFVMKRDGIK